MRYRVWLTFTVPRSHPDVDPEVRMCCLKICEATIRPEGEPIPKMRFRLPPTPAAEAPPTPVSTLPKLKLSSSTSTAPQITAPRRESAFLLAIKLSTETNHSSVFSCRRCTCTSRTASFQHSRRTSAAEEAQRQDEDSRSESSHCASFGYDGPRCRILQEYPQETPEGQEISAVQSSRRPRESRRPRLFQRHPQPDGSRYDGPQAQRRSLPGSLRFQRRFQTRRIEREALQRRSISHRSTRQRSRPPLR